MTKCGYNVEQSEASEQNCVGCHYLLEYPQDGQFCDWREADGIDTLKGPTDFPEPLDSCVQKENLGEDKKQ